jgi:LysR family glycine cleavage system transcriptional activator
MKRLRDRLPPANSMVVFEAVARHLSFTRAAKELRVSQAAVSRQVKLMEDYVGVTLFNRLHRAIELTPQGVEFNTAVSIALEHIAHAVDEIRREEEGADVTISCSVAFASYWLMTRIAKFRAQFPEIDVRLVATGKGRDLAALGVDFGVRYGRGQWDNVIASHMFENEIFPVCSPSYLDEHGPLKEVSDLTDQTLLYLTQFDKNWVTWDSWFEGFGTDEWSPEERGLSFDNYMILIHAAIRGEGLALCGERFADDLIERGELVRPIDAALKSDFSFYLVHPANQPPRPNAQRFMDWLLAEAQGAPQS